MVEYGAEITTALLAEAADAKLDDERRPLQRSRLSSFARPTKGGRGV
jgi:hypothetical protein